MNSTANTASSLMLIDDDAFSAHLLTRMLQAAGAPKIAWLGDAVKGRAELEMLLSGRVGLAGNLLIIDLKANSTATLDFIVSIAPMTTAADLPVVAMTQSQDRDTRVALYHAGAAGVFVRHADLDAYRLQAAEIVSFWARIRRPAAVGM